MHLIPLFPLQIVVFPNEKIPLHIFEERYRELVKDCEVTGMSFGISSVINGKMSFGTEVELVKVVKHYEGGESDIICMGKRVFKIENFYNKMATKLYAGAEVSYRDDIDDTIFSLKQKTIEMIKEFYKILELSAPDINEKDFKSFDLAHKIGFSLDQEHELLQLMYETDRLNYIMNHLKTVVPIIKNVNNTKDIIKLNGHFRSFDPMDFKDIKWE